MIIQTIAYNKQSWIKEQITVEGNTLQEMQNNANNQDYEANRILILESLLNKEIDDDKEIVLKNSQFVYFAPINEVITVLKGCFNYNPDRLCNYLDRYDRKYQK